mgnify:CR=1 FL=1
MELTILIVVLFLGVGIPLRNKRYKKWKKKREDKKWRRILRGYDSISG